jgi:crotonobetainyl-CoA:carnitine CoA-transferase CaiB-like acyl-CoA transferase
MTTPGALEGLRVLDLSRILAGPTCTQLLGDLGADVIKVERPGAGDDTRAWGPPFVKRPDGTDTQESAYYLCANRNKRSVAIDLSTAEGAEQVRALAATADVLVENFKVGTLARYGLDYPTMAKGLPGLVYCSITGFGQTGPHAHRSGYDLLAQGFGGMMSLTGEPDGEPMKVGVGIADVMCGMYAATAILAAVRHRDRSGEGQHIDLALVDAQMAWLVNAGTHYLVSGEAPKRYGNQHPNIVPYQVFATRDGHIIVAVGNDAQYRRFCTLIDREEWATDARFITNAARLAHREVLVERLAERLRQLPSAEVLSAMEREGVPGGPIHTLPEALESDQAKARDMTVEMTHASGSPVRLLGNPLKLSATPVTYRRSPPECGADTAEVLEELQRR